MDPYEFDDTPKSSLEPVAAIEQDEAGRRGHRESLHGFQSFPINAFQRRRAVRLKTRDALLDKR